VAGRHHRADHRPSLRRQHLRSSPARAGLGLAAGAIAGATVGFYGVLVVSVAREQRGVMAPGEPRYAARLASRTVLLLAAEFGAAELLDTFLWRPALMMSAVVVLGEPVWGLLAGKTAADVLFYVVAAVGYRVTELTGLRTPARRGQAISHM
jgi:hypothetical protein